MFGTCRVAPLYPRTPRAALACLLWLPCALPCLGGWNSDLWKRPALFLVLVSLWSSQREPGDGVHRLQSSARKTRQVHQQSWDVDHLIASAWAVTGALLSWTHIRTGIRIPRYNPTLQGRKRSSGPWRRVTGLGGTQRQGCLCHKASETSGAIWKSPRWREELFPMHLGSPMHLRPSLSPRKDPAGADVPSPLGRPEDSLGQALFSEGLTVREALILAFPQPLVPWCSSVPAVRAIHLPSYWGAKGSKTYSFGSLLPT